MCRVHSVLVRLVALVSLLLLPESRAATGKLIAWQVLRILLHCEDVLIVAVVVRVVGLSTVALTVALPRI